MLIILIPIGICTKYYSGTFSEFMHHYAGGFIYVVFFIMLASVFFPKKNPGTLALAVFLVTSLIECSQLVQNQFINDIRQYFLVRALIGTTFVIYDFPVYMAGAVSGYLIIRKSHRQSPVDDSPHIAEK